MTGGFNSLSMILLFLGIFFFIFLAARFFLSDSYTIPSFFEKIPGVESLYTIARSVPSYLGEVGQMVLGKKNSVSFASQVVRTREKDQTLQTSLETYFTDTSLPLRPFWIFIPFCNLLFIPKLLTHRTTQYVLAIGQGLVLTLLAICIGFFTSFTSPLELFLLFPLFYGIASLENNVFTRIPLLYEIYIILNSLTFGLLKSKEKIQKAGQQDTAVSFKID